ncbi:histone-lysine N-methyltransferase PRDM7-like [Schistocerca cancellata]|uniref:histone-lysine N-methyltransferase PRDM7-like n=2 Tax=Schistocerca TaxID=7008 RepID=UPI0021190D50|nr:histone-lysine N-methyltransferase PRDM7-like [Schistocerca cancellata]
MWIFIVNISHKAMADEDMVEVPEKLSKWFTHDEWKQMSYYERKRTLNVLENYHTLTGLGINVPKPDFMYPALHKTPRPLTQITPVYSTNKVTERPKEKDQYSFRDAGEVSSVHHSRRKPPSYELRKRKYNCYREDSSSDDDDYLFCDECNREWFGDCPSHGPLIHIMDTQVSVYPLDPERAAKTLPSIFRIGPSAIRKAGLGVWTTTSLLPRTVFGPYEGSLSDTANDNGKADKPETEVAAAVIALMLGWWQVASQVNAPGGVTQCPSDKADNSVAHDDESWLDISYGTNGLYLNGSQFIPVTMRW